MPLTQSHKNGPKFCALKNKLTDTGTLGNESWTDCNIAKGFYLLPYSKALRTLLL